LTSKFKVKKFYIQSEELKQFKQTQINNLVNKIKQS